MFYLVYIKTLYLGVNVVEVDDVVVVLVKLRAMVAVVVVVVELGAVVVFVIVVEFGAVVAVVDR